jgi:hypothetical protein
LDSGAERHEKAPQDEGKRPDVRGEEVKKNPVSTKRERGLIRAEMK